jgi:predicted nucleotide-binding protein (sugar kinase/HSP70/actin superfamily)
MSTTMLPLHETASGAMSAATNIAPAPEVPIHEKVLYIPHMSDHTPVLVAALRFHGSQGETLPLPSQETMDIGLSLCRGRECLPCFLAAGDVIRACRAPGFDQQHSAFLMPSSPGPCRFGQYRILQRTLMDREGFTDTEILSPSSENSYRGFGAHPRAFRLLAWTGVIAVDLLLKLLYEFRPYELEVGATDAAYARGLERLSGAMAVGGGRALMAAMREIAKDFEALPVDRSVQRPVVAFLGENYVMLNPFSNQELIRKLEAAGAEVVSGALSEWLHFVDETKIDRDRLFGSWLSLLGTKGLSLYQRGTEHRLRGTVAHLLRRPPDASMRELFAMVRPYFDPLLGMETTLTLAKSIELARNGVSGVVNVMPFSCMPGIVVAGMAARIRADHGNLPWLDVIYDGQHLTNIRTRLEAFVHQVGQFARTHAAHAPATATG